MMSGKCINCGRGFTDHEIIAEGVYCPGTMDLYVPMSTEQAIDQRITALEKKIDLQNEQIAAFLNWARDVHGYTPGSGRNKKEEIVC